MKSILALGLTAGVALFSATQAQAASLTIDDFDTELQDVEVEITTSTFPQSASDTSGASANILGEFRTIEVEVTNATFFTSRARSSVLQSIGMSDGLLSISNEDGVESNTTITWDAAGAGLNVDLFGLNNTNAFELDVESIDLSDTLTFTVLGNNGETAMSSQSSIGMGSAVFEYEDFALSGGTVAGLFSDVQSISLEVTGPASFDASFDNLDAINVSTPEPAAVLGLVLALGGGALSRKKK